jgi:hypothetical protein
VHTRFGLSRTFENDYASTSYLCRRAVAGRCCIVNATVPYRPSSKLLLETLTTALTCTDIDQNAVTLTFAR